MANSNYLMTSKNSVLFFIDVFFGFASLFLAFLLKYDWVIPPEELNFYFRILPFVFAFRAFAFLFFRFKSQICEDACLEDIGQKINSIVVGSVLILFYAFGSIGTGGNIQVPFAILIIDAVILLGLQVGFQLAWKEWRNYLKKRQHKFNNKVNRALVWGAGNKGALLLERLRQQHSNCLVVGLIDDDELKIGNKLGGINVLGSRNNIPHLVKKHQVDEILIAFENITTENLNEIFQICQDNNVNFKIIPSYVDRADDIVQITKNRDIEIKDLLGREPVRLDEGSIRNSIQGRVVMVTGAGGSIGTELCEQLLKFEPASLVLVERGENYLHELKVTLDGYDTSVQKHFIFCSVTNKEKMENVFERFRPDVVFHAAANKHVPIMELNVDDAINNNVYGTKVVADLSDKYKVSDFVLISTDKVVKPSSIMGMTKRIAEQYIQFCAETSNTRFLSVRFGNVLGSKGSVVPLFKQQIARGGPITITHPDMERFLMLIPEAVGLILQAAAMREVSGRVFVLEMGNPVKIVDLAKKMIRISGYNQNDIEIKYVGIRPGEKLTEELVLDEEEITPTFHNKIKMLKSSKPHNPHYDEWVDSLCRQASGSDKENLKSIISEMIPDLPSPISTVNN